MSTTFIQMLEAAERSGQPIIIDGGLGTALESRGIDLGHELWSAALLREAPDTLAEVHASFIRAGARIATTASYQATPLGFERAGIGAAEGRRIVTESVRIARTATSAAAGSAVAAGSPASTAVGSAGAEPASSTAFPTQPQQTPAFVAGSVGPYGAALGDGAEYTGDYHLSDEDFATFHRPRIEALAAAGADLLAVETQPRLDEIRAIADLAEEVGLPAWVSVTLLSGTDTERKCCPTLPDGSSLAEVAKVASASAMVHAIGVNCVRPSLVTPALTALREHTDLPLIAYPNSGERYDAAAMQWRAGPDFETGPETIAAWTDAGAVLIGGCCRTTPDDIAALAASAKKLSRTSSPD